MNKRQAKKLAKHLDKNPRFRRLRDRCFAKVQDPRGLPKLVQTVAKAWPKQLRRAWFRRMALNVTTAGVAAGRRIRLVAEVVLPGKGAVTVAERFDEPTLLYSFRLLTVSLPAVPAPVLLTVVTNKGVLAQRHPAVMFGLLAQPVLLCADDVCTSILVNTGAYPVFVAVYACGEKVDANPLQPLRG